MGVPMLYFAAARNSQKGQIWGDIERGGGRWRLAPIVGGRIACLSSMKCG
jgi:hypothetical protein